MEVLSKIQIYEIDGKDVDLKKQETLSIESHWNYHDFVVIGYNGKLVTVNAEELIKAITNAGNW